MNLNSLAPCSRRHCGMSTEHNPGRLEAIASRLIQTRKALGLNQRRLCNLAGVEPNTYNQWEKAKGRPELDQALKLCQTFGYAYTLDWIYRGNALSLDPQFRGKLADAASGPTAVPEVAPKRGRK